MISIFCAPGCAPQVPAVQPVPNQPRLDALDLKIIEGVREHGPAPIWSILTWLADQEAPRNRAEARTTRLALWGRLRRLLRLRQVFRVARGMVGLCKPAGIQPESRQRRSSLRKAAGLPGKLIYSGKTGYVELSKSGQEPAVGKLDGLAKGSTLALRDLPEPLRPTQILDNTHASGFTPQPEPDRWREDSQCAPKPAEISSAARALARLPRRRPKKWTGFIGDEHVWRDREILLPNGEQAFVYGCLRQQVVFTYDRGKLAGTFTSNPRWGVIQANQVAVLKNPAAVALGRMKLGRKERHSEAKAAAARANGRLGGRPRKR